MFTIDASVWVNSFDRQEAGHEASRQALELIRSQARPIIVPSLVLVEVAAPISRTRGVGNLARSFAHSLSQLPNVTFLPLDMRLTATALDLAAAHRLRGADAVYAAVAVEAPCALVTLDNEQLRRLQGVVHTLTPAELLAVL